jgi:hypothetical protein
MELAMNAAPWMGLSLIVVTALGIVGLVLIYRAWPRPGLTPAERSEMAAAPMPPLKKRAWSGLVIGMLTLAVVWALVASRGAAVYWSDDQFRLTVMLIFIAGLVAHALVTGLLVNRDRRAGLLDERDRSIQARAPVVQSTAVLLTLAAWTVWAGERFHDQGAVPMVYLYLLFGLVILVMMIAQSLGVLLFYWLGTGEHRA